MSYRDLYDQSYQFLTPAYFQNKGESAIDDFLKQNNKSLVHFISEYFEHNLNALSSMKVAELGCGLGGLSFHLNQFVKEIHGYDISPLAIASAKEINQLKQTNIKFDILDVTAGRELNQKYDLIIDSHLLHCLTSSQDRAQYLEFVSKHLNPGGLFLAETMTFTDEIQEPLGYDLTQEYILLQEIQNVMTPIRTVYPGLQIEEEIKNSSLHIKYFYFHAELNFDIFPNYPEYPSFRLPKTIRLGAVKTPA